MEEEKKRKEKLSIYLAREKIDDYRVLVKQDGAIGPFQIEISGGEAMLYIKREFEKPPPPWTKLFSSRPDLHFGTTRSVGAILTIRRNDRIYALTFGTGYHLLNTEAIERDFGLRVTINSVEPEKLRSIDKASYSENPLNSRTQSTTEVDIFDLNIDSELEMLYALTGSSKVPLFGSQVTGRDALTIAVEIQLDNIPEILDEAFNRYTSKLPSQFEWVDNIRKVKDPDTMQILDLELEGILQKNSCETVWLGEPEIVDWERQMGYSFDMYPNTERHVVLELDDLLTYMRKKERDITTENLRIQPIHINDPEFTSTRSWSAYRCIYAEIIYGSGRFLLRNGIWFEVDDDFVSKVDSYLKNLEAYDFKFPIYAHDREEQYNDFVASNDHSFSLMDKKNTKIGGRYDKIEFCDLVKGSTDLVHVKLYRSSGTLSHLFAQGSVAAETFVKDEDFRQRLNQKLPERIKLKNTADRPDVGSYRIVYAVATNKSIPDELPFFSKVTLRNAIKNLRALGYGVHLAAIEVDPNLLAKKKYKPKNPK